MTTNSKSINFLFVSLLIVLVAVFAAFSIAVYNDVQIEEVYAPENLEELVQWPTDKLYILRKNLKCSEVSYTTIANLVKDQEKAKMDFDELVRVCRIVTKIWLEQYDLEQYQKSIEGKKYLHKPTSDK